MLLFDIDHTTHRALHFEHLHGSSGSIPAFTELYFFVDTSLYFHNYRRYIDSGLSAIVGKIPGSRLDIGGPAIPFGLEITI